MREKLDTVVIAIAWLGITPACAGKAKKKEVAIPDDWDHPRVCGKSKKPDLLLKGFVGSPPRVREKRVVASR